MGNEHSSSRYYDDDETAVSGMTGATGYTEDRTRSSRRSGRTEIPVLAHLIDSICGRMVFDEDDDISTVRMKYRRKGDRPRSRSMYDSFDDDATFDTEMEERERSKRKKKSKSKYDSHEESIPEEGEYEDDDEQTFDPTSPTSLNTISKSAESGEEADSAIAPMTKPLASAFAKRCFFTKAGIGPLTQHYEGNTLTGNTVLMLSSAMKLKGCPTICDEDLRRVEETFPNQFSRLPDELLLSSGWRRISKYCHFSGKAIPDGVPFFHSKERVHPQTGGYYFLLASSLGMDESTVEPLSIDMLILMQADYPQQCDQAPKQLLEDPNQWHLVTKFCFFSGGPINTIEDVYYEADFDGRPIYMLAFLSPNLTPEELYKLNDITGENALKTVAAVEEVDEVYDLNERDFDDLRLYHMGPCRSLQSHLLKPDAWKKILPPSFIECREKAFARAYEFEAHAQMAVAAAGKLIGNGTLPQERENAGYVEFNSSQKGRESISPRGSTPESPLAVKKESDVRTSSPTRKFDFADSPKLGPSPEKRATVSEVGSPSDTNFPNTSTFSRRNSDPGSDHSESFDHNEPSILYDELPEAKEANDQVRISPQISPTPSDEQQPMDEMVADSVPDPHEQSSPTKSYTPSQDDITPYGTQKLQVDTLSQEGRKESEIVSSEVAPLDESIDPTSSISTKDLYSRSTAMKGAHELLKKNREQRLKFMEKRKSSRTNLLSSAEKNTTEKKTPVRHSTPVKLNLGSSANNEPASPKSPTMAMYKGGANWSRVSSAKKEKSERDESKKILNVEDNVSDSSSTWTDATEPVLDQRRALILKMAKNRMKGKQPITEQTTSESQEE